MIEAWDRIELTFAIEQPENSYGDVIENVVIMGEFVGRSDLISPVNLQFHVKFVSPVLGLKY